MNEVFMATGAAAIACTVLIVIEAMRLAQLRNHVVRQEAKLNLIQAHPRHHQWRAKP
jgi:hypothetical protein